MEANGGAGVSPTLFVPWRRRAPRAIYEQACQVGHGIFRDGPSQLSDVTRRRVYSKIGPASVKTAAYSRQARARGPASNIPIPFNSLSSPGHLPGAFTLAGPQV
jgi:hypothetical protein